jgi:hypothetical protein
VEDATQARSEWGISVYATYFCSFYYYTLFATYFGHSSGRNMYIRN